MKSLTQLSQRDSRWRDDKLGYGDTTIGSYGCLITALSMLARLNDVRIVNQKLKENSGYTGVNGNLVIWAQVSKIPNLRFNYRYYSYDNNKVKEIIQNNGGCIVEVDGTPIGGSRHWLVYIGNGQLLDPWTGTTRPTSSYTAISFVDISYEESEETMSDTMEIEKSTFETLVGKSTKYDAFVAAGFENSEQAVQTISQLKTEKENCQKEKEALQKQVDGLVLDKKGILEEKEILKIKNGELSSQVETLTANLTKEKEKVDELQAKVSGLTDEIIAKNLRIQDLEADTLSMGIFEFIFAKLFRK